MIIQRLFSNRQQKALRKAYDLRRGWGLKEGIAPTKTEIKTQLELSKDRRFQEAIKEDLRKGRSLNDRTANIGKSVDSSINSKAVNTDDFHGFGSASGNRLAPKQNQYPKKWLKDKNSRKSYDHSHSSPSWNKEEMQLRAWKKTKN
jgi:hypothetical protein